MLIISSSAGDVVDIYQREFLALRERLHSAEQENLRRSKELNLVLEEIKRAIAEKQALRDINRTWSSLSGQFSLIIMMIIKMIILCLKQTLGAERQGTETLSSSQLMGGPSAKI